MLFYRTDDGIYESNMSAIDKEDRCQAWTRLQQMLPSDSALGLFLNQMVVNNAHKQEEVQPGMS